MAPKNKSETKFSYKGNVKSENKYSNIYEDLIEKETAYVTNSLKKTNGENADTSAEEVSVEEKFKIKHVSLEEAKENAMNRKRRMKNERIIATQKSSPVIDHKRRMESGSFDDIERLKREKKNGKSSDFDHFDKVYGENLGISIDDEDSILNNPKLIREEARKRVQMDKSNVEIFKEYTDFESFNKLTEGASSKNEDVKVYEASKNDAMRTNTNDNDDESSRKNISNKDLNSGNISNEKPDDNNKVDERTSVYDIEELYKNENLSKDEKIKKRESEIEELIRLMKQDSDRSSKNRQGKDKQKVKAETKEVKDNEAIYVSNPEIIKKNTNDKNSVDKKLTDFRSDVYRRNSNKDIQRVNYKKIAVTIIILLLLGLFIAAGVDKFLTDSKKSTTTSTTTTAKTTDTNKAKEQTSDDKVKTSKNNEERVGKLKAIKSKLNVEETERLDYILENMGLYPNEMLDLLIRNPETIDFVYSYKDKDKYNNKPLSDNISSSYYVDGSVPLFLQWDRRWGYRNYGSELTGLAGCGPTSLAMVIRHFDKDSGVNPYDVAKYSQENGYVSKDNFTSWSLFENGITKYGLESRDIIPVEAKMKKALDDGQILIASVKPGIFTERGHIIVIKGYNKDGDFLINDPNSIINTNKNWSFDELKNEIRKIWGVSSVNSQKEEKSSNTSSSNSSNDDTSRGTSEDPSIIQDIN